MELIDKIKKAINDLSFQYLESDRVSISVGYLLVLKRHIEYLEGEIKKLEVRNKFLDGEIKKLTGKLIECENKKEPIKFETYI